MSRFAVLLAAGLAVSQGAHCQAPSAAPLTVSFDDALKRARANTAAFLAAETSANLASEDRMQARAALLPTVDWVNQFIYTQPNGRPSGVFVSNDGPHIYNNQAVVHGELFSPAKRAEYRMSLAAEAVARARTEVAARGLAVAVTQSYYALVAFERRSANARRSLQEAEQFLGITQKQEQGGEVARTDVVKAQIQREQRQRDAQEAELSVEKARIELAVLIFRDFRQDFSVVDDLEPAPALPPFEQAQALAAKNNPDIRVAQETVRQETYGIKAARAALLPSLSFDYFFGINATEYAVYDREHFRNLGSVAQAQLSVPIWTWGATRSKVRQAELRLQQAQAELSFTQRGLLASLQAFHREADVAVSQMASLRRSSDLAAESVRLTMLGYQAGEATALEVVDAQTTLTQARNAVDDGLVRYRLALANLQTLTGTF